MGIGALTSARMRLIVSIPSRSGIFQSRMTTL